MTRVITHQVETPNGVAYNFTSVEADGSPVPLADFYGPDQIRHARAFAALVKLNEVLDAMTDDELAVLADALTLEPSSEKEDAIREATVRNAVPLPEWQQRLLQSEELKKGDRVQYRNDGGLYPYAFDGAIGTITAMDDTASVYPYLVIFPEQHPDHAWRCRRTELTVIEHAKPA